MMERTAVVITSAASAAVFACAAAGGVFEAVEQNDKLRAAGVSDSVVDKVGASGAAWAYWGGRWSALMSTLLSNWPF